MKNMNPSMQLQKEISGLNDKTYSQLLLESFAKNNFNLLFRQVSVKSETLRIVELLYLHKDYFKVDVNAKGASNKCALEFAIEKTLEIQCYFYSN